MTSFYHNCNHMLSPINSSNNKRIDTIMLRYFTLVVFALNSFALGAQTKVFVENNLFKQHLKVQYPEVFDESDSLLVEKALLVRDTMEFKQIQFVIDSTINYFPNIRGLNLSYNTFGSFPNISKLTELEYLMCYDSYCFDEVPNVTHNVKLKHLDLSSTQVDSIIGLEALTELEILNINSCHITVELDLRNNVKLEYLNVRNNNITHMPNLTANVELKELYVGLNPISELTNIETLTKLTHLGILECSFERLPDFTLNENLHYIMMNRVTLLQPADFSSIPKLDTLHYISAGVSEMPMLGNNKSLRMLNLQQNFITYLGSIEYLDSLEYLDLSNNSLHGTVNVSSMTRLKYLNIENNEIDSLSGFENLYALEELLAKRNTIASFPVFPEENSIRKIDFYYNQNLQIPHLMNLNNLEYLNLSACGLTELPSLFDATSLQYLNLEYNRLKIIPDLHSSALEYLNISNNYSVDSLPDLAQCENFKELRASDNKIGELTSLQRLQKLQYVDVSYNQLTALPDFSSHTSLRGFIAPYNCLDYGDAREFDILFNLDSIQDLLLSPQKNFGDFLFYEVCENDSILIVLPPQDSAYSCNWYYNNYWIAQTDSLKLPLYNYEMGDDTIVIYCKVRGLIKEWVKPSGHPYSFSRNLRVSTKEFTSQAIQIASKPAGEVTILANIPNFCVTDSAYEIQLSPTGGELFGNGITEYYFSPSQAGIGEHSIVYEFNQQNGCKARDTALFYVDSCTDNYIPFESTTCALLVHPTDVMDKMQVSFSKKEVNQYPITLYTICGSKVTYIPHHFNNEQIDVRQLLKGIYFIECEIENTIYRTKFIKL